MFTAATLKAKRAKKTTQTQPTIRKVLDAQSGQGALLVTRR
jgi:hypothetical protein